MEIVAMGKDMLEVEKVPRPAQLSAATIFSRRLEDGVERLKFILVSIERVLFRRRGMASPR